MLDTNFLIHLFRGNIDAIRIKSHFISQEMNLKQSYIQNQHLKKQIIYLMT